MTSKAVSELADLSFSWEQFIAAGRIDSDIVRLEILESWKRCYEAGVEPYDGSSHLILNNTELEELLDIQRDFIEIARHFMVKLSEFVSDSGFIVVLSDERGYIMEIIGNYNVLKNASRVNLVKGSSWIEEEVGTNGIGTAIILKEAVQVSGGEHYCKKLHDWTCSAAPIFNDNGQMIGALQMSGPSYAAHLHTLGMVVAAVEAISDQLRVKQQNRELTVLNNSLNNIFQTMSDGAVIIDKYGTINQINPIAEKMLGKSTGQITGNSIENVFGEVPKTRKILGGGQAYTDVEIIVDTVRGNIHCLVTAKPIKDEEGNISGAVIFFNPINKVKKLINRFSGAQATFRFKDIMGSSEKLREVMQLAVQASSTVSNVLIEGESGTGKELFAQAIHNQSLRKNGPFVALNCGAIPRELIASELFGYAEGAFTGAKRGGRTGKFELASGGTLFFDEIGDMPLDQQASLLRVLQEKKITRIACDKVIPVDVRVICASNKNLKEEVKKGNFRQDLYYRLNVILLSIPPLRERREDIPLLFKHFLKKISQKLNANIQYVQEDVIKSLQSYDWPGNVREMENVVEKMISMANGDSLYVKHLPAELLNKKYPEPELSSQVENCPKERKTLKDIIAEKERETIISLLFQYKGNISQVAREMGVSRNTIYRKIEIYNISQEHSYI